jgi:hypothetical protein
MSFMERFNELKNAFSKINKWIMNVCSFFEKIKNILIWEDPIRTFQFILTFFLYFIIFYYFPLRYLIVLASMIQKKN